MKDNEVQNIWETYLRLEETSDEPSDAGLEIKPTGISKARGKHPIQLLLDYGYRIVPNKPGAVIAADGQAFMSPELYDAIIDYLKQAKQGQTRIRIKNR